MLIPIHNAFLAFSAGSGFLEEMRWLGPAEE